jgi:hypothetical protein
MPHPHLQLSERDIEHLLQGDVPPGRGDLADLARVFARVRAGAAGEKAPPMSPRLLAELDAAELSGRQAADVRQLLDQRRVRRGRRRWRVAFAAAAAVAVIGGVTFASMRGPLGDDLRTRPGDDPVSVAEPDGGTTAPIADDSSGGIETAGPDDDATPDFSNDDEKTPGDRGQSGGAADTVPTTTAATQPPTTDSSDGTDWGQVADDCHGDSDCLIDAAQHACEDSVECWTAAARSCDDYSCRAMMANMLCGGSQDCWEAVMGGAGRHPHR